MRLSLSTIVSITVDMCFFLNVNVVRTKYQRGQKLKSTYLLLRTSVAKHKVENKNSNPPPLFPPAPPACEIQLQTSR